MKAQTLVKKYLPQNPDIEVLVPNYKEPILPVNHGGFGWYGLLAYNEQGQVMCHECGVFRESLGKHIRKHGLSGSEYRQKFMLLSKSKLSSVLYRDRMRSIIFNNSERLGEIKKIFAQNRSQSRVKGLTWGNCLERQNKTDTCDLQLLRRLVNLSEIWGIDITAPQVEKSHPGLVHTLIRHFGSFNKAKQLANLVINEKYYPHPRFPKQLILEDMCHFYFKYGRWPAKGDYRNVKMICSYSTLQKWGVVSLRKQAMKLREQQEAARIKGEGIPTIANKIEMEFAGRARR